MPTQRILGIDTGTNSLGWAVIDRDSTGLCTLVRRGCLIFQEGVKRQKNVESSKAAERTTFRAARRHYFRRRLRKVEVLKVLVRYGWCPYLSPEALHDWQVHKQYPLNKDFMAWQHTDDTEGKNPYACRHRCLHETLDLSQTADRYDLGRAFYHLAQRRGFLSNRLDQTEEAEESGTVKTAISELSKSMQEAGFEYLGDYFYHLYHTYGNTVRIRNQYTDREQHYRREFEAICKQQRLSDGQIRELERALYFQRPLKSQRQSIGKCTFEPSRPRCADSHPAFERYRMLNFVNHIRIMGPHDAALRPLTPEEKAQIEPLFYRKKKHSFDFEDIAKKLAGKGKYQYVKDEGTLPYRFNHRMTQSVPACPTCAALRSIFGADFANGIAEQYLLGVNKTPDEMVNDVWNVLYSFADKAYVKRWGIEKLQLDDAAAEEFSQIKVSRNFSSLSLCAIRKILPWLERGLIYARAVMLAKIPDIVGHEVWEAYHDTIVSEVLEIMENYQARDANLLGTLDAALKDYLANRFELQPGAADRLYHPSMTEAYPDAHPNQGILQLGSPRTNAVRNPMAMRSLHQLRKVINRLLRERVIDSQTEVHIEYARELNDTNKRAAIAAMNREREAQRKKYAEEIAKLYREETGRDITPTNTDILKFELWEEQHHRCLYTGEQIGITDFIGEHPLYDIEHTIPRSLGGDSTRENLTLCSSRFNRDVKQARLPAELPNHAEILERIETWKDTIEDLRKKADKLRTSPSMPKKTKDNCIRKRHKLRLELDYWREKYHRFNMESVPEGFSRRQGTGIGLIGKYAGLYLKSLFHNTNDRSHHSIRVVKGATTAEFRKIWGIQEEYERKSRDNHVHHCIDAIVVACITTGQYNAMARYYQQLEAYERSKANRPEPPKPWPTFTEDIKSLVQTLIVAHETPDNTIKHTRKKGRTADGKSIIIEGDTARGPLHGDSMYGAIMRNGKLCYVIRRKLEDLKDEKDVEKIVDEKIKALIRQQGLDSAHRDGVYLNREKGIRIKKVRCYASTITNPLHIRHQRDASRCPYKQECHVQNEGNYMLAIYEGTIKGKPKRAYKLVCNLAAASQSKKSADKTAQPSLVPPHSPEGYPLRWKLKIGMHVILYSESPEEIQTHDATDLARRLYYISGLSFNPTQNGYGTVVMTHHQEARRASDLKIIPGSYKTGESYRPKISMLHTQFCALVEGYDFYINVLGEIVWINPSL